MPTIVPDESDLEEAVSNCLARMSSFSKRYLTGDPRNNGDECVIFHLAKAMVEVDKCIDERFASLVTNITKRQERENLSSLGFVPARATDGEIRYFFSLFAGCNMHDCRFQSQVFCRAVRTLRGEGGLREVPKLVTAALRGDLQLTTDPEEESHAASAILIAGS